VCRDLLDAGYHVALWFEPSAPATAGFVAAHLDFPLLQSLSRKFNLDSAESTLLLLLALQEIDPPTEIPRCPRIRTWADFALQFPHLANPRLLLPGNPLRNWNLVQPTRGRIEPLPLAQAPLVLSERILAYLLNDHTPDARLAAALVLSLPPRVLAPPQRELALAIANRWRSATHFTDFQTIALQGQDPDALLAIAGEAASQAGFQLARLNAAHLPASPADRQAWRTLWQTEALLSNLALYLDATAASREECAAAGEWLIPCGGAILLGCQRPASLPATFVHLHAPETRAEDRAELISSLLNGQAPDDPQFARRLAGQFDLGVSAVYRACLETHQTLAQAGPDTDAAQTLWRACRERARPRTGSLTQLIESKVTWEDLILPDTQLALLREAANQVRQQYKVHDEWGFAAKSRRGLNLTALFSGPSGTGKTLGAEVIANHLQLDLLRVDLSTVVSKYIGETEKHLSEVFDSAECGGAILLFDEADALFGPRSRVSDSRDRHANIEVSYLLQRLETFRGLAILTTNFRENLDQAFLRRIRFHVEFPFPDRETRARLWRHAFPAATPLRHIDFERLSRLSLAGGNIRNVALNAAFQAAAENTPVLPSHIANAARGEFRKAEKPIPEAELRDLFTATS
jgi:hypothetical protein